MEPNQNPPSSMPVSVYTPESRLRRPKVLFEEIWSDLKVSRELSWELFRRQLSARYRQTALGPLWVLVPPVVTALMATLLRGSGVVTASDDDVLPYPLRVFFASVVWGVFAQSLVLPLKAMADSLTILRTMRVSVEGFLLAKVGEILFDQGVQFIILFVLFLVLKVPISAVGVLISALLVAILIALGMSLGFFLVPIGSLYLDVNSAIPFLLRGWFFLTPIIYSPPTRYPYSLIADFNPVTPLLQGILDTTTGQPLLNGWSIIGVLIFTLILFGLGWIIYRVSIPLLVER
ncbi:MAG: ABC transporter permease [Leptolyngbyaceae bacterium]|nr:ABC transporter permease [Leptolyngbyaceae bacterium]